MEIYNALQIKNGAKVDTNHGTSALLMQPVQFLPSKEKDEDWVKLCFNYYEFQGLKQLRRKSQKMLKNYRLASGQIDRSDYIVDENNESSDLVDLLTREERVEALELKFYPLIPTFIDILANEYSKRVSKVVYKTVDELSFNERLEEKRQELENTLISKAYQKKLSKLLQMGVDISSEEVQQELAPENLKTLPEIENFFKKSYRNVFEEWATHQHRVDEERFRMRELEIQGFRDKLIVDHTVFHYKMMEDDYEIELWNPPQVFYSKSPSSRFLSQSNWIGMIDLMSPEDVIDKYGWMMTSEELESLQYIHPAKSAAYLLPGYQNDGSYYNASMSHEWNTEGPSLQYRQLQTARMSGDIVDWIVSDVEDLQDFGNIRLLRVTTLYWKTQRKMYILTKIGEDGMKISDLVSEEYKVTEKPVYDTTVFKTKTKDNLVYGEHLDCIWINEVWGGVKIGPHGPTYYNNSAFNGFQPILLGMNGGKPGRISFQFKGDTTRYGCKPPVEGCVFTDRNTMSWSFVDTLKPFQIGYNLVNNQINDICIDELGTVVLLDQNALPKHSLGEDWGKNNFAFAYNAMKNFQILPMDNSLQNTEVPVNFQHYTQLDLSQTQRLLSRIQLSAHFETQAMKTIGFTPERLGQQMSRQSATGVEMSINASYAQTEQHFIQYVEQLMPRVHQMRTDLAQFYHSTNPSVRLQYLTSADEEVNFQINGTKLLTRDFNIFCTTNSNARSIMEQIKSWATNNNTMGATLADMTGILKAESLSELERVVKAAEEKVQANRNQELQLQQQQYQEELAAEERQKEAQRAFEAEQNELDRQNNVLISEIRAAGYGSMMDINQNKESDFQDAMKDIRQQQQYQDTMNFKREQEANKNKLNENKLNLDREKLDTQRDVAEKQLQVARENKNKYDSKKPNKK